MEAAPKQVGRPHSTIANDKLENALLNDKVKVVRAYLNDGGDPNDQIDGVTLLTLTANNGSVECMQVLLTRGAKVNLAGGEGETPLIRAASSIYRAGVEPIKLLLARGANPNLAMPKGTTALMWAASPPRAEYEDDYATAAMLLLTNGAHVNARNKMGTTALSNAKTYHATKIVKLLIASGAKR